MAQQDRSNNKYYASTFKYRYRLKHIFPKIYKHISLVKSTFLLKLELIFVLYLLIHECKKKNSIRRKDVMIFMVKI